MLSEDMPLPSRARIVDDFTMILLYSVSVVV